MDIACLTVKVFNQTERQKSDDPGSIPGGGRYSFCNYYEIFICHTSFCVLHMFFVYHYDSYIWLSVFFYQFQKEKSKKSKVPILATPISSE
jgi:hypothetical protein